ncbi:hypothetical protein CVT25_007214 [Psilocybe cyanescens]|uniref:Uncharacterized protein n=1 Tax=Psilocybe cyanescens TaxID=93625 RepID=A0A409X737_PSICY|nr:hypothetical protein CVT25_007214 [Psilocybe cyanescens]
MLAGAITSSVYLLEHAIWSCKSSEPTRILDAEVFRRWVIEGGMESAIQSLRRTKSDTDDRVSINSRLAFGAKEQSKL